MFSVWSVFPYTTRQVYLTSPTIEGIKTCNNDGVSYKPFWCMFTLLRCFYYFAVVRPNLAPSRVGSPAALPPCKALLCTLLSRSLRRAHSSPHPTSSQSISSSPPHSHTLCLSITVHLLPFESLPWISRSVTRVRACARSSIDRYFALPCLTSSKALPVAAYEWLELQSECSACDCIRFIVGSQPGITATGGKVAVGFDLWMLLFWEVREVERYCFLEAVGAVVEFLCWFLCAWGFGSARSEEELEGSLTGC